MPKKPSYEELEQMVKDLENEALERKRAEEALRESEENFRTFMETAIDLMHMADKDGNLTYVNESMARTLGYSKEEMIGMHITKVLSKETLEKAFKPKLEELITKGEISLEPTWVTKDGKEIYGEIKVVAVYDSDGNYAGSRGVFRDLTERKRAEEQLRESEERFRLLTENTQDIFCLHKPDGRYIYVSPSCKNVLEYEPEELIGKDPYELVHPDDRERIQKESYVRVLKGENILISYRIRKKSGEYVWFESTNQIIKDEKGNVAQIVSSSRDITERKQAEEERRKLEAQLGEAQRLQALGTLAGGIAHNFNNLLMGVMGNTSLMLLETDPSHPNYERLKNIEKSAQNGSGLTRQLLGYAREGRFEIKPISLNQVVEETSNTFGTTRKEVRVRRELAEDLWGIKADQGQIEQILLNLYVNAADAMPGGGDLFLKTTNITHNDMKGKPYKAKPGNYVLLTVTDTGVGMGKKTMERVFDPFFTTKGLAEGTGLGLASVYGIIKAHGGYIDVESKKGQGTTFSIYLPASERKVEKAFKSAAEIIEGTGTILLVDDEEMVLDVGVQLLKALGYTVLEAKGGREAVEIYRENKDKIDMVLLDMIMPDMGGGEAYDRMKEINPDIKVLLSSGYSIDGQATEIIDRGCDRFIQKPFDMKQLSRSIRETLDKK